MMNRESEYRLIGLPQLIAVAMAYGLLVLSGCNQSSPITVYESVPKTRNVASNEPRPAAGPPKFEMTVAIVEQPSATWFFKIAGQIETMQQVAPNWDEFLKSVTFDEQGQPVWQLPEGWTTGQGSSMRFATLIAGPDPSTSPEVSVSQLPPGQDLLGNVNRWRGQLGLGPINRAQLPDDLASSKQNPSIEFKIFNAQGPILSTGMAGAPFAGRAGGPPMRQLEPPADSSAAPAEELPIDFTTPDGWQPGQKSTVYVARWSKTVDDQTVEIAVLNMNPSDESWRMNVEAWSAQLRLAETPDVGSLTQPLTVAGQPARRIRLDATDGEMAGHSVIAVMISGQNGWLIKYSGNTSLLDQQMDNFESFLASISIR